MAVRTTVDIPNPLHDALRRRAQRTGVSIRSLIVGAVEQTYGDRTKSRRLTGPLVTGKGKLGRAFPKDENPHDLVFS